MSSPRRSLARLHPLLLLGAAPALALAQASPTPLAVQRAATAAIVGDSGAAVAMRWRAEAAARPDDPAPRLGLALLARGRADHAATRAWLDSAARVAAPTPRWRAAVAREAAAAAMSRSDFATAATLAEAALADTAGLPADERARVRLQALSTRQRRGGRLALAALDSVAAFAPATDSLLQSRLTCARIALDAPRRARMHAEAGATLAAGAGDPQAAGHCLVSLGALLTNTGDLGAAAIAFAQADSFYVAARDPAGRAAANQRRAYVNILAGQIQAARTYLEVALREAARVDDPVLLGWALINVAQTHAAVGDRAGTTRALGEAGRLLRQIGDLAGVRVVQQLEAQARLDIGDVDGALAAYTALRATANDPESALLATVGLADAVLRSGDVARAGALLDSLEAQVLPTRPALVPAYRRMRGRVALRRGDMVEARRRFGEAAALYGPEQAQFRYENDKSLAWTLLATGDTAAAAAVLLRAHEQLDRFRDVMSTGALRTQMAARRAEWGGGGDEGDATMAALATTRRHAGAMFELAERQRSRALTEHVIGATTDSALVASARGAALPRAATADDVRRALPAGTALLVFAGGTGAAPTTLFVVTRDGVRGLALAPLGALDALVTRWNALLEAGDAGRGAGAALAAATLGDALPLLPRTTRRLVIVPQGALHRVPWGALPLGRGLVADRFGTTTAPSVALALRGLRAPATVPARVLAIGAGDAARVDAAPGALSDERGAPLAPLPAADDEARIAATTGVGSRALVGDDATEGMLARTAATDDFTVLHAAAHALTTDQALGASWLILRADATDDGYVSGGELARIARGRALVVLSGCRTTGDFGSRGDAVDGLVAPLLATGVRSVVASHWAVSDRSTRALMTHFYEGLGRGATVADALAAAQRALRRAGAPPRAWAAFTVIGDGSLRLAPAATRAAR